MTPHSSQFSQVFLEKPRVTATLWLQVCVVVTLVKFGVNCMVGCKATRNCQCFWQYFLNFWTFCDIKSSCFGHSQKKLWRYVKLQSCSFYWVKAKWRLHFACKGKNNFVRKTNFPEFCWRQQNHGFSFWKFLCCPIKLPRVIIMASIKLILGVVVETRVL